MTHSSLDISVESLPVSPPHPRFQETSVLVAEHAATATQSPARLTSRQARWRAKYGPWAVVTGASDGIGRELAVCLAEAGLNLVLVARRRSVLEQLAANLSQRCGVEIRTIDLDFSTKESAETLVTHTNDLEVGLLVASAGFGTSGRFLDADVRRELNMIDVNCRAVLELSYRFGQRFADQRRGGIVLMSSLVAFQGVPRAANYAATKAYIQSLAEALHVELAPLGVDVVASAPGPVHSGFAARADMRMGLALQPSDVAQATLRALGRKTTVRPGWLSKFLEASLKLLPRWGRVRIMRLVMTGMTGHQDGDAKSESGRSA